MVRVVGERHPVVGTRTTVGCRRRRMFFGAVRIQTPRPKANCVQVTILGLLIFAAAVLYSSVGHAGASGYLAAMALFGVAPAVMKPAALTLNIAVALITTFRFYRAGHFSWRLSWPFVVSSVPLAFVGGAITLPGAVYRVLVGLIMLFAAYRMFWYADHETTTVEPWRVAALGCGAVLGFVSGLTGVGGGIFLSPLLLFMGWANFKQTAGTSSAFILLNSTAGLLGHLSSIPSLPPTAKPGTGPAGESHTRCV